MEEAPPRRNNKEVLIPKKRGKSARRHGRGSGKFTEGRIELVLNALSAGLNWASAASAAGITVQTLQDWRACDEEFAYQCEAAIVGFERRLVDIVDRAAAVEGDWKAAAWILERRFRKNWGRDVVDDSTDKVQKIELKWSDDG